LQYLETKRPWLSKFAKHTPLFWREREREREIDVLVCVWQACMAQGYGLYHLQEVQVASLCTTPHFFIACSQMSFFKR
jgi:hypothetical protein